MNKIGGLILAAMMVLSAIPFAAADTGAGGSIGIIIDPINEKPHIWMDPTSRAVIRNPADGTGQIIERTSNYAFMGEQVQWNVLVLDRNGIEKISDVYVSVGEEQGSGDDIEANCDGSSSTDVTPFDASLNGNPITIFDSDIMRIYTCTLTVENGNPNTGMYGDYWVAANVVDLDGNLETFDENENWYFNPVIELEVDGLVNFEDVVPGQTSYSGTVTITNDADEGSGVLLDMQISGDDFYDSGSSGAKCPTTNKLNLNSGGTSGNYNNEGSTSPATAYVRGAQSNCDSVAEDLGDASTFDPLCYFATNGAYSTNNDATRRDAEGYVGMSYKTSSDRDRDPVISSTTAAHRINYGGKQYFAGNVLSPGSDLSVTFRLLLPQPCNGEFSDGSIFFWGEAI